MPDTGIARNGKLRSGSIAVRVVGGLAEPVGKFIASKLGVRFEAVMYPNPEAYVQSFGKGEWDIAIGARVLAAAEKADLGDDLWLVDLIYVSAPGRAFADASQVDKPGIRVGVISGSPSDRHLSHDLKSAQLVRIPLSPHISTDAIELLRSGTADVIGVDSGIGYAAASGLTGATIVPGPGCCCASERTVIRGSSRTRGDSQRRETNRRCPKSNRARCAKRRSRCAVKMSAYDPKRTLMSGRHSSRKI